MSGNMPPQTPPPQSPPPPQQPQAPGAYPYPPGFPTYGAPGYYGYFPWYVPQPPQPPTPVERPADPAHARLANLLIAVVATASTVVALILAAVAPALAGPPPSPASLGFHQVYDAPLTNDTANWDASHGCAFEQGGLHAPVNSADSTGTICPFSPSVDGDLTSQGFYLVAKVGPAAAVSAQQQPCIALDSPDGSYELTFDQSGDYLFEPTAGNLCSDSPNRINATVAWHADSFTDNQIGILYSPSDRTLTVYVNNQTLLQQQVNLAGQIKIGLGASADGEAVFTHFTLQSGNAA